MSDIRWYMARSGSRDRSGVRLDFLDILFVLFDFEVGLMESPLFMGGVAAVSVAATDSVNLEVECYPPQSLLPNIV